MLQSTLYPWIAESYKEELQKTLDELKPSLLEILHCYKLNQKEFFCDYCMEREEDDPCRYLLVDSDKFRELLTAKKELLELEEASYEFLRNSRGEFVCVNSTELERALKALYKYTSLIFSSPEYSIIDRNFVDYFKKMIFDIKSIKKGERTARKMLSKNPMKKFRKFLFHHFGEDSEESLTRRISVVNNYKKMLEDSLVKLEELCNQDRRVKKVEELTKKFIRTFRLSTPLKRRIKTVGNRKIIYYTKFELDVLKNRPEERKVALNPLGSMCLDAFLAYSNPIQKYSLLKEKKSDVENRIRTLKWELNSSIAELRHLEKFVDRKNPIKMIKSIPSSRLFTLEETINELIEKVEERKSRISSIKKPKYHNKKVRKAREWLLSVDTNKLRRKLKNIWKISKILEELEDRLTSVSGELENNFSLTNVQPRRVERLEYRPEIVAEVGTLDRFVVNEEMMK